MILEAKAKSAPIVINLFITIECIAFCNLSLGSSVYTLEVSKISSATVIYAMSVIISSSVYLKLAITKVKTRPDLSFETRQSGQE